MGGDVDDTANSYSQGLARSPGAIPNGGQEKPKKEKRDLTTALQLYGGLGMRNAHSALADADATLRILIGQLDMWASHFTFLSVGENHREILS